MVQMVLKTLRQETVVVALLVTRQVTFSNLLPSAFFFLFFSSALYRHGLGGHGFLRFVCMACAVRLALLLRLVLAVLDWYEKWCLK